MPAENRIKGCHSVRCRKLDRNRVRQWRRRHRKHIGNAEFPWIDRKRVAQSISRTERESCHRSAVMKHDIQLKTSVNDGNPATGPEPAVRIEFYLMNARIGLNDSRHG